MPPAGRGPKGGITRPRPSRQEAVPLLSAGRPCGTAPAQGSKGATGGTRAGQRGAVEKGSGDTLGRGSEWNDLHGGPRPFGETGGRAAVVAKLGQNLRPTPLLQGPVVVSEEALMCTFLPLENAKQVALPGPQPWRPAFPVVPAQLTYTRKQSTWL